MSQPSSGKQNPGNRGKLKTQLAVVALFLLAVVGIGVWVIHTYMGSAKNTIVITNIEAAGQTPALAQPAIGPQPAAAPDPNAAAGTGPLIGGVVRDEQGRPIANAAVTMGWVQQADPQSAAAPNQYKRATARTDATGHWTSTGVPRDVLDNVNFGITQRDFVTLSTRDTGTASNAQLLDQTAVFVMRRGLVVSGIVTDSTGKPISGAQVRAGTNNNPTGITAVRSTSTGQFSLRHVPPDTTITVSAMQTGFAPAMAWVQTSGTIAPVKLVLTAGRTITGRVTDADGKPVAGVNVTINQWAGSYQGGLFRSVTTNADGQYTMRNAPADTLQLYVYKQGYTGNTQEIASDVSQLDFKIGAELTMSGTVTDAKTSQPVGRFTVLTGAKWQGNDQANFNIGGQSFTGGHYRLPLSGFSGTIDSWYIRVQAKGYLPAVSPPLSKSGTVDFQLEPASDIQGRVLTADGKPVIGAQMAVSIVGQQVGIQNGQMQGQNVATTDTQGHFDLPPQIGKYVVVAVSPDGFATADQDELAKSADLHLSAWGHIQGTVIIAGKPAANQQVSGNAADQVYDPTEPMVNFYINGVTDAMGHFSIDRVAPGDITISRLVQQPGQNYFMSQDSEQATVNAGETTTVAIGGSGRPVNVALTLPPESSGWHDYGISANAMSQVTMPPPPMPPDVQKLSQVEQQKWWATFYKTDAGKAWRKLARSLRNYAAQAGPDGNIHFENVAPGNYRMSISAFPRQGGRYPLATATTDFTIPSIPGGYTADPLIVPPVALKAYKVLSIGDAVPEIAASTLDGKPMKLADYHGKYVLMILWLSRGGIPDSNNETEHLKAIYSAFHSDARFVMLGLSADPSAKTTQDYVQKNNMAWPQGLISRDAASSDMWNGFSISRLPDIFLIGPDGKLIARDLAGDAIMSAVTTALKPPQ